MDSEPGSKFLILNRVVRITPDGLEYEADPKHVELITESLNLAGCKSVNLPGVKNPDPTLEASRGECDLGGDADSPKADKKAVENSCGESTTLGGDTDSPKAALTDCENMIDLFCALTTDNPNISMDRKQHRTSEHVDVCSIVTLSAHGTPDLHHFMGFSSEVIRACTYGFPTIGCSNTRMF